MILFEGVHPLEGGAFRMKFRRDRRFGMRAKTRWCFIRVTRSKPWSSFEDIGGSTGSLSRC